jgi:hypothetical protein
MELGDLLIRSSVRLAMACYGCVLLGSALSWHAPATTSGSRALWTVGCTLFWVHVASAFEFYHHWSHEHAFLDTAEKTRAAIGVPFGYGIYVNHLFALVWTADVAWSWLNPRSFTARPKWLTLTLHGFMLFIVVNGLMVFKDGLLRWISAAVLAGILGAWIAMWLTRGVRTTAGFAETHDKAARP